MPRRATWICYELLGLCSLSLILPMAPCHYGSHMINRTPENKNLRTQSITTVIESYSHTLMQWLQPAGEQSLQPNEGVIISDEVLSHFRNTNRRVSSQRQ